MNGNTLISAVVGAILLFAWQSLSWAVLNLHENSMDFTDGQIEILNSMEPHLEQNMYYLSHADPDSNQEEYVAASTGHPVALVNYIPSYSNNMGKLMGLGFLYAFFVALVVSLVINGSNANSFIGRWLVAMGFAVVLICFDTLGDMNWWYFPSNWVRAEIIDYLVMFAVSGAWFAWWLGRGKSMA